MKVVVDEIHDCRGTKTEIWYEVYVVDDKGNLMADTDDIYNDIEKAFDAIKRLVKEYLA